MRFNLPKRWLSAWLTLGLVYLSLAVFTWGLQYKLSLYNHADGSSTVPAAKLLTGSDKAVLQQLVQNPDQSPSLLPLALILFSFSLFLIVKLTEQMKTRHLRLVLHSHWKDSPFLRSSSLFFRPPPVR